MLDPGDALPIVDRRLVGWAGYGSALASNGRVGIAVFLFLGFVAVVTVVFDLASTAVLVSSITVAVLALSAFWTVVFIRDAGAMSRAATFARDLETEPGCAAAGVALHEPGRFSWLARKYAVLYADDSGVALLAHEGAGSVLCEESWSHLSALEVLPRTYLGRPSGALFRFEGRVSPVTAFEMAPIEIAGKTAGVVSDPLPLARRIAASRSRARRT